MLLFVIDNHCCLLSWTNNWFYVPAGSPKTPNMKNKHVRTLLLTFAVYATAIAQQVVPVTSFGTNGTFKQDINDEYAFAWRAVVQPDGKLLFSLNTSDEFGYSISQFLYRITQKGNPDSSFGTNGILKVGRPNTHQGLTVGGYFDLQPDEKIVTANVDLDRDDFYTNRLEVERFLPNGTPDSSFGIKKDGSFTYENEGGNQYYFFRVEGIKIRPTGKILIVGSNSSITGHNTMFIQLNSNGRIDRSFGDSGLLQSNLPFEQSVRQILLLPNNQFITASVYLKEDNTVGSCLVAHKADGTIDSSRGINGVMPNNNTIYDGDNIYYSNLIIGLKLQADNKLLEYTIDYQNNMITGLLLRYNRDGSPDKSFGNNGRITTGTLGFSYNPDYPNIVETQTNGRVIVDVGQQLQRYLANGTLDATFGTNGVLTQPDMNQSMVFTLDANRLYIVGAGYSTNGLAQVIVNAYTFCNHCTEDNNGLITQLKIPESNDHIVKLYPNPVSDKLTITGLSNDKTTSLQLTNATGRVIKKVTTQSTTFQWNMQALPPGVYYLILIKDNALPVSFKVIKSK